MQNRSVDAGFVFKYAHDYSHGNNLHAPKHEVNAFTENMHAMVNV